MKQARGLFSSSLCFRLLSSLSSRYLPRTPSSHSFTIIDDAMTYPDLWIDFSFARSSKRRRSAYGDSPQLNDLTSQYPILLSLAENLSTLDLINLGLASRTTWHHLSAPKRPYLLRKGVVKTSLRCEGLHIQPRPQSPHQGTPYVLPCASSQFVPVKRCESCGVAVCEVCQCIFPFNDPTQPNLTLASDLPLQPNQRRHAHLHAQTPLVLPFTLLLAPGHRNKQHRNNARQHGTARPNSPARQQHPQYDHHHRLHNQQRQHHPPHNRTTLHPPPPPLPHLLRLHSRNPLARPLALRPLPKSRHLPRPDARSVLRDAAALLSSPGLPARKRHRPHVLAPRLRRRGNSTYHGAQAEIDGAVQSVPQAFVEEGSGGEEWAVLAAS